MKKESDKDTSERYIASDDDLPAVFFKSIEEQEAEFWEREMESCQTNQD